MFSDEVVCIDASGIPRLKQGEVYPFLAYKKSKPCGCNGNGSGYIHVGFNAFSESQRVIVAGEIVKCCDCLKEIISDGLGWYKAYRFAPIESQDISELTSVLEEEPFKV